MSVKQLMLRLLALEKRLPRRMRVFLYPFTREEVEASLQAGEHVICVVWDAEEAEETEWLSALGFRSVQLEWGEN